MRTKSITTFIFDFDGTLADSLSHVAALYDSLADQLDVPRIPAAEMPKLRRMGPREVLDVYGIPLWKVPRIVRAVQIGLREQIDRIAPFGGVQEILAGLRHAGARCFLLTSNSRENVEAFVAYHNLDVFEQLVCGASLFGKGTRLRKILAHSSLLAGDVAYVGDEVRDVEAAKSVGIGSIAVSWGYADRESLQLACPDYLIDAPGQLLELYTRSHPVTQTPDDDGLTSGGRH